MSRKIHIRSLQKKNSKHGYKQNGRIYIEDSCICNLEEVQNFIVLSDDKAQLVHYVDNDGKNIFIPRTQHTATFYRMRIVDADEYLIVHQDPCDCEYNEEMLRNSIEYDRNKKTYFIHRLKKKKLDSNES